MKHRSISVILLFIVSAMLIGVFAGCNTINDGNLCESSTTEEVINRTYDTNISINSNKNTSDITDMHIPENIQITNYLEFDPPLEPISQELMLEIREAWAQKQYEDTQTDCYGSCIAVGDSEDEALQKATKKAEKAYENAEYVWFVLYLLNGTNKPLAWYYRYYGMIGDYVVLSTYIDSGFAPYGGFTVGGYEFAYPNGGTIYLYKDGVFALFANAYNMGLITQDQVALVHGRYTAYESVFNKWYKDELEKYYVDEHLTE